MEKDNDIIKGHYHVTPHLTKEQKRQIARIIEQLKAKQKEREKPKFLKALPF